MGIDLGTTHSLVAVCERGRPRILRNALGELLTPSAVSFTDDDVRVGTAALERATVDPDRTFTAFKRDMGTDRVYLADDRRITPVELSALVLRSLKEDGAAVLGQPVERAVISVPAYFDENQRRATRDAADLAGLEVLRLVNEPTAAAIAHGLETLDQELKAIVLDLGGGTFDVTVVEIIEGVIEIQSSAGDSRLGGEDFTEALARWAIRQLGAGAEEEAFFRPSNPSWRRLLRACEIAKRHLSRESSYPLKVDDLAIAGRSRSIELEIDIDTAEELWQPVLERIRTPIRRALKDADTQPEAIDRVLLVGGASRMPCFVRLATRLFGQRPLDDVPVDEVVAHGAALQAALTAGAEGVEDLIVTDVAAFSMGVEVMDFFGNQPVTDVYSPILERGTVLPSSRRRVYYTMSPDQPQVRLGIYQGEHPTCSQNLRLGELVVEPIPKGPAGLPVDVRFSYDLSGVLEVKVSVDSGESHSMVIEQASGRLSRDELDRAREALAQLEFHPRDALPNTAALAKAEALFLELRGSKRDHLATLVNHFRQLLETTSDTEIEEARSRFLEALTALS